MVSPKPGNRKLRTFFDHSHKKRDSGNTKQSIGRCIVYEPTSVQDIGPSKSKQIWPSFGLKDWFRDNHLHPSLLSLLPGVTDLKFRSSEVHYFISIDTA